MTFTLPFDLTGGGHALPADLNGDGLLDFLTDFGGPGVFIQAKIADIVVPPFTDLAPD